MMTEYALLNTSDKGLVKTREFGDRTPPDVSHKGWEWVPVERKPRPEFNSERQKCEANNGYGGRKYVFGWRIVDKTPEEIEAEKDAKASGICAGLQGKVLMALLNEARKPTPNLPVDEKGFHEWVKALL